MISSETTFRLTLKGSAISLICILFAGCAGNQTKSSVSPEQAELYQGKAILSYLAEQQAKTPAEAIAKAEEAQLKGDSDRALYQYIRAYELENENPDHLLKIAQIHYQRRNFQISYQAYQRALKLDNNLIEAHQGSGMIMLNRKQYDLAEEALDRAVQLYQQASAEPDVTAVEENTDTAENTTHQATTDTEATTETKDSEDKKITLAPVFEAYNGLGIIHDIRGRYDTAQRHYKAALKFNQKISVIRNNLGYSYYMQNKWQQAEEEFLYLLKDDNQYAPAWKNLGLVYARQEKYITALDALEQVMDTAEAYNDIGYICMLSKRYQQAAYFFRKAISENPKYYETAQQNLARVNRILDASRNKKVSF